MKNSKTPYLWKGEVLPYLAFAILTLFCQQLMAATLVNGVTATNLASSSGNLTFTIDVPAGSSNLSFSMSGGTGDADLYVRYGSAPTTSTYDCRPYQSGNNESCPIANVQAGTYHVSIAPYSAFTGVSLLANFTEGGGSGGGGSSGDELDETNVSGRGTFIRSLI